MKFAVRYFREYYQLKREYQDIAQMTGGFGLVAGIFFYWFGWGSLLRVFIGGNPDGGQREFTALDSFLVFIGLPISLWCGFIAIAMFCAVIRKITWTEAVSLGVKFTYPRHWLKPSGRTDTPQPTRFNTGQD